MEIFRRCGTQCFEIIILLLVTCCVVVTGGEVCKSGYNYPPECPRPGDPADRTKCCRNGLEPYCCEERADSVCAASRHTRKSGGDWDPPSDWYAIWCPQPGDPDSHTICSWNNNFPSCFNKYTFIGIFVGVFGGLFVIGMIILIVCCCLCKKGHLVCVKIYDDGCNKRYTCMTRSRYERFQQQRAAQSQNTQGVNSYQSPPPAYQEHNPYQQPAYPIHQQPAYPIHQQQEMGLPNKGYS